MTGRGGERPSRSRRRGVGSSPGERRRFASWLSAPALMLAASPALAHGQIPLEYFAVAALILIAVGLAIGVLVAVIALALQSDGWLALWVTEGMLMVAVLAGFGLSPGGFKGGGFLLYVAIAVSVLAGFFGAIRFVRGSDSERMEKAQELIKERQRAKRGS